MDAAFRADIRPLAAIEMRFTEKSLAQRAVLTLSRIGCATQNPGCTCRMAGWCKPARQWKGTAAEGRPLALANPSVKWAIGDLWGGTVPVSGKNWSATAVAETPLATNRVEAFVKGS